MYMAIVVLLMLILPVGSIAIEQVWLHSTAPLLLLVGKWFVFWSVGVRLLLAGVRQLVQPEFTASEIFHLEDEAALPLVRELGVANLGTGFAGVASIVWPSFTVPIAISAGIFYGIAGLRHMAEPGRSANETVAMASDLFVFLVLAVFILMGGIA
jgi:hypothetical protein